MSFPAALTAPSLDDFAVIARAAFDALPEPFRQLAGEAVIRVADFAEADVLADLEIEQILAVGVGAPRRVPLGCGGRRGHAEPCRHR